MIRKSITLALLLLPVASLPATAKEESSDQVTSAPAPAPVEASPVEAAPAEPVVDEAAPDTPTTPHSTILPVKIKPVQEGADGVSKAAPDIEQQNDIDADTLALYTSQSDGSLGQNLWTGLSRDEVIKGLHALPVPRFSPSLRELTLRVLLSKATVAPSKADPPVTDVFAARMSKLIELGAFREAMSLYEKLDSPATTAEAALAGMKAFVGNGQVAIACLEQKALDPTLKSDDPFWKDLDQFCQTFIKGDAQSGPDDLQSLMRAAVAYAEAEKIVSPSQFEDLNSRSLIHLMVLSKAGILDRGKWSVANAAKLDPSVIAFLLAQQPEKVEQKLSLFTVAVAHGIRSPQDLETAFKETAASPVPHGDWAPFLNTYTKLVNAGSDADRIKHLKTLLALSDTVTPVAFAPLTPLLTELKPAAPLTADEARIVLRSFISAGAQIPLAWVSYAYGQPSDGVDSGESELLAVWNNPVSDPPKEGQKTSAPAKAKKPPLTKELAYSLILQAYLKDEDQTSPADKPAYDNFLSLTGPTNYVMPSGELTESLKKAAQAGSLGKILLYSLQMLNGEKVDQIHPQTLSQVLKALKTAGLSEETVSLAHEALEGLTTKKEN